MGELQMRTRGSFLCKSWPHCLLHCCQLYQGEFSGLIIQVINPPPQQAGRRNDARHDRAGLVTTSMRPSCLQPRRRSCGAAALRAARAYGVAPPSSAAPVPAKEKQFYA